MAKGTSAAPASGANADRLMRKIESLREAAYCADVSGTGGAAVSAATAPDAKGYPPMGWQAKVQAAEAIFHERMVKIASTIRCGGE